MAQFEILQMNGTAWESSCQNSGMGGSDGDVEEEEEKIGCKNY